MNKRGSRYFNNKSQVTIFIILGIVIVVFAVLLYMFFPKIKSLVITQTPAQYFEQCMQQVTQDDIENISLQGGTLNPQNYFLYQDNKVDYLCYTNEYYKPCVMQKPMLIGSVETEIRNSIKPKVDSCLNDFKKAYEGKGYSVVISEKGNISVDLFPKNVVIGINYPITLSKEGISSTSLDKFNLRLNNDLYGLLMISTSILNWEAKYGDSETTTYMDYFPDVKVEKLRQTDGTKIYILTNRDTGTKFQFATRSVALPPGYGIDSVTATG